LAKYNVQLSQNFIYRILFIFLFLISSRFVSAQTGTLSGTVRSDSTNIEFANILVQKINLGGVSDSLGKYRIKNIPYGEYHVQVNLLGYETQSAKISISASHPHAVWDPSLVESAKDLNEVVVSGTMKEVSKLESAVNVEVYSVKFFKSNPTPSLFECLANVNGVRPQLNCNVCNTGDIHMNGLEGPYTMVLIDGMPIVSGLSTVYGLTGIPQSLIDRMEIVKGPASTLYGSEAVGGLINIITKKTENAPLVSVDVYGTTWGEVNADLGCKFTLGKKLHSLIGANYFNYQIPIDHNHDGFTDVTLQNRISVFNKWTVDRKNNRVFNIAGRFVYEDRWGGDMRWNPSFRGGDSLYAESIYTTRWEAFGIYQLPVKEKINFQFSANGHYQNSVYGKTPFMANQYIAFGQFTWNKKIGTKNDMLVGFTYRFIYYDDNTTATAVYDTTSTIPQNQPSITHLPGIFIQDEITFSETNKLLVGIRYDYNTLHGSIFCPRVNYKWNSKNKKNILRIGAGNGYRVANVFTEDHAALTGARMVVFAEKLLPETSWNGNINFVKKIYVGKELYIGLDFSAWYTYFSNRIIPDYLTDPNKIIYRNLNGFSQSTGGSVNLDISWKGLRIIMGATGMDVSINENHVWRRQLLTEQFTGTWNIGYNFKKIGLSIDYTGNVYGPMKLPLLGPLDDRPANSPWFSIQNIQITKSFKNGIEIYGGIKNLLNYTPPANSIARPFDPFDKQVTFDSNGQVVATANNPHALTFDPSYVFASNQGIRGFMGIRYNLYSKKK
jgi:outer membrane receptor for ferrienterochelin and colicins